MRNTTETYYLFKDAVDKDEIVSNYSSFTDDLVIGYLLEVNRINKMMS